MLEGRWVEVDEGREGEVRWKWSGMAAEGLLSAKYEGIAEEVGWWEEVEEDIGAAGGSAALLDDLGLSPGLEYIINKLYI